MARTPIAGRKFYPSTKLTDARQISLSPERFIRRRKENFFVRQTVVLFAKIKSFASKIFSAVYFLVYQVLAMLSTAILLDFRLSFCSSNSGEVFTKSIENRNHKR